MDELLMNLAKSSPIALVAIFALWRMSVVMLALIAGFLVMAETVEKDISG